ncbi:hypothetical protein [Mycobacteroides abscessus]|uniref:hypothetical protein n=1 Tax=Mycobacteroides abscessus TaxID=36809 RepID=UPI000C26316B|nr:hypothetical protein [Mycobacteroides abscessus]PVB24445.1 hypothetical protein DDJ71_06250 [Mycobacteroides abscessus]
MKIDGYSYRNDQGEWVNLINPRLIPAPVCPVEPEYESEDLPDQKHVWNEDGWDGDHHSGSVCSVCFYHSECQWCEPEDLESEGCLRKQAHDQNCQLSGAVEWAYTHDCPREMMEVRTDQRKGVTRPFPYSPDPDMYAPMCRSCHTSLDMIQANIRTKAALGEQ